MNTNEIRSLNNYLIDNGILSSKNEVCCNGYEYMNMNDSRKMTMAMVTHKGFIVELAKKLQFKSYNKTDAERLSLGIYAKYINSDNIILVRLFKRIMMIYQRNKRKHLVNYYLNWKLYIQSSFSVIESSHGQNAYAYNEGNFYEHFDFSINKNIPKVHQRLFNDYKLMEHSRHILAMNVHANEAEKCTFVPIVNHDYYRHLDNNKINSTLDCNLAQFDSIDAQHQPIMINNSNSSINVNSHCNKINNSHRNSTYSNSNTSINSHRLNVTPYSHKNIQASQSKTNLYGSSSVYINDKQRSDSLNNNCIANVTTCPSTDRFHNHNNNYINNNANTLKTNRSLGREGYYSIIPFKKNQNQYPYKKSYSLLTNSKSASSKNLNLKRLTPYEKLLISINKNTITTLHHQDSTINNQQTQNLTNQSSYNSLMIQTPYFNPTLIPIPPSSNRSSKIQANKTPKYSKSKAEHIIGSTTRDTIGRHSQDESESFYLKYPKKNHHNHHLSLKSYDNSIQTNMQDKVIGYMSKNNNNKQLGPVENYMTNRGINSNGIGMKCSKKNDLYIQNNNGNNNSFNYKEIKIMKKVDPIVIAGLNNSFNQNDYNNNNNDSNNQLDYYAENEESLDKSIGKKKGSLNVKKQIMPTTTLIKKKKSNEAKTIINNNNLRISSKVVNENWNEYAQIGNSGIKNQQYNTIYANQITLQTINDSKMYEIANHYITTDESLDRYKCISNYNNTHRNANAIHK